MRQSRKQLNTFRQGRVSARAEARRQIVIRNNLEKRFYKRLNTLFRKFANVQLYLLTEFGIYEPDIAQRALSEDLFPLMLSHYKRVFQAIYRSNEDKYDMNRKADAEAFVFGRSVDFESVVNTYFASRTLILEGISGRMAQRISNIIEQGRADNLTLQQIAGLVTKKFRQISRTRAALISRTETHNAASTANHSYHATLAADIDVKMLKQWVATSDARTRSAHSAANGQTVDMSEDFIIGGSPMQFAGDSKGGARNVINCRCVIVYVDENDSIS